ncbi:MAG TPA: plastocyanin/azurin family copper-binding protein [Thermoleophilaceae bacterium]
MRRATVATSLGLAALLAAAPSLAADQTVHATGSSTFSPKTVTIAVGESVTFTNDGGIHNVRFDDGQFTQPSSPSAVWSSDPKRTFDAPGTYRYYCEQHGGPGGVGMAGTVVVQQPGSGGGDTTAPAVDSLRVTPATFCNRKTGKCPKRGARLRFTLSEDARVTGPIVRRRDGKTVGKVAIDGRAGKNDVKFSGKGLALGKYRLTLTAKDAAGNVSPAAKASFKIATKR